MTSSTRAVFPVLVGLLVLPLALAPALAADRSTEETIPETLLRGGTFDFTLELLSPRTQATADSLLGPYFFFLLTNTGSQTDTYHMEIEVVGQPAWFGQCCIGQSCFPDSADITVAPAMSESVGVKIDPFFVAGVGTGNYSVASLGDPGHTELSTVTLYAGSAAVGVEPVPGQGTPLSLRQNFPNPVRASTSIEFALPHRSDVTLEIYDVAGRTIRTLLYGSLTAGPHAVTWDGRDRFGAVPASGVYYYRLYTPEGVLTRRMTVLH